MAELQTIPARHGVATFVPAGQTIKIVNTSGSQVVDTWAFALPKPTPKTGEKQEQQSKSGADEKQDEKQDEPKPSTLAHTDPSAGTKEGKAEEKPQPKAPAKKGKKNGFDLPSQEEAEKATRDGIEQGEQTANGASKKTPQKKTWGSYVPSIGWSSSKKGGQQGETQQQKDSRTWASYFSIGKGFSNYVPESASNTVASLAGAQTRDPNKSYLEQLQDFSKTPVGAAGMSGFAALTGSGYSSAAYAGYQAWNAANAPNAPPMEFVSMPHTRAGSLHIRPRVNDVLLSNLREPMLTLVEDTSPGVHDTLMAACDPQRYHGLGVEKWEEHGSCAENLVLALKELNERAGLKGAKGVGADVTINNVPAPLNLFMNIPWDKDGESGNLSFDATKTKEGDYVRFRAERDVVVVMSACPQDILDINNKAPTDAHFIVEDSEADAGAPQQKAAPRKRPAPRKLSQQTVTTASQADDEKSQAPTPAPEKKPVPQRRAPGAGPKPATTGPKPVPAKKPPQKVTPGRTAVGQKKAVPARKPSVQAPQQQSVPEEGANGIAPADVEETAEVFEKKKPKKLAPKKKVAAAAAAPKEENAAE